MCDRGLARYRSSSGALAARIEIEAQQLVREAYDHAVALLTEHEGKLVTLAEALLVRETLHYDDVAKLVGPRPFESRHPFEGALDALMPSGADVDAGEDGGSSSGGGGGGADTGPMPSPASITRVPRTQ